MYTETTKLRVYGEPDNMEQIEIHAKETEKDEKHGLTSCLTLDQSTNRLDSASTFLLTLIFRHFALFCGSLNDSRVTK